jgi:CBS domain-containing protein
MILAGGYIWLNQGSLINGVWFAVLGWFLLTAAGSQELQTRFQRSLAGISVRDVMPPDPVTAPDWITVEDFVARFANVYRNPAFPLRDFSGQLSGVLALEDLRRRPLASGGSTQLRAIARPIGQVPIASPGEALIDVVQRMDDPQRAYALVLDDGQLVGIISPADIRRAMDLASARAPRPTAVQST